MNMDSLPSIENRTVRSRAAPWPAPGGVRRTSEIEEATNRHLIHPVSTWLTYRFARLGVAPNTVSLTGMAAGLFAGFCYAHDSSRLWIWAGLAFMLVWHVMDGADGQLARLTGRQSASGKVLDGICDYVTFIAVYVGLALVMSRKDGAWVWGVVAFSGLCHALQSAAYEFQRQEYDYWGHGRGASPLALPTAHAGGALHAVYARAQRMFSGHAAALHAALGPRLAPVTGNGPEQEAWLRARYRATFAPVVRHWSILCANYRTFGLFAFAILGIPLGYFLFESVVLSAVLAFLILRLQKTQDRFIRSDACPVRSLDPAAR